MCLFFWPADENRASLGIEFGSEVIKPQVHGELVTRFDHLLANTSEEEHISSLDLITPHGVPLEHAQPAFRDESPELEVGTGRPEHDPWWPYLEEPTVNNHRLTLVVPHHSFPERPISLSGALLPRASVVPWVACDDVPINEEEQKILEDQDYSGWRIHLDRPLGPGEKMWCRWILEYPPSPENRLTRLEWIDHRLVTGETRYDLAIFGPLDVMDRLLSRMAVQEKVAGRNLGTAEGDDDKEHWKQMLDCVRRLRHWIDTSTSPYREHVNEQDDSNADSATVDAVKLQDYRICLWPDNDALTLENVERPCGDVREAPGTPDGPTHQWKTGTDTDEHIPSEEHRGRFHMRYDAVRYHYWWRFAERVLVAGLSVAALIVALRG